MSVRTVVTVVGSFAVGMTIRAPRFPVKGETLPGSDFDMGPGGKGSNQAVGAARLGAKSGLVAKVGEDRLGDMALELYRSEGVDATFVTRTGEHRTGAGVITLNAEGDNHIVVDLGANRSLAPEDVDRAEGLIRRSDAVLAVLEIPIATAARAMELARRHGAVAILNPAPAQALPDPVLRDVDVLSPNDGELRILSGLSPDDRTDTLTLARRLQARGARSVVVTRGARGALAVGDAGAVTEIPATSVDVVDTTGAGDAFNCALAVALGEGRSLEEAARFAACAGALACTKLGVIPSLPTREVVEALLLYGPDPGRPATGA